MSERGPLAPRPRPGQLKVKWGRIDDFPADLVYAGGEGTANVDRHLLMHAFASPRYKSSLHPRDSLDPSLLEELEARGYDLTTLTFSISKKAGA